MMLANADVMAFVATADPGAPRSFYEGVLGLHVIEDDGLALAFEAHGTMLRLTRVRELTPPPYIVLGWAVPDIVAADGELEARGLAFVRYTGFEQDEQGIWTAPTGARIAWFTDPDGNTLQLLQTS